MVFEELLLFWVPLSEHERGLGLGLVVDGRRAADDDGGATVSPQRVLQDPSHLTVSVRHVAFLTDKNIAVKPFVYILQIHADGGDDE